MRHALRAEIDLVGREGWSTAMSAHATEEPRPAPTAPPPEEDDGRQRPHIALPRNAERYIHARNNDRVYQAAGDQFILDHAQPAPPAAQNTLPRDNVGFTGRTEEMNNLISMVTALVAAEQTLPIVAVNGMAGVGKTTFAVRAGHLLSATFPGGQVFIDLRGHSAGADPVEPAGALLSLLSVAGVPNQDIPGDLDGRSALWRARMAGRRSILILDNAASRQQVEPLLPGAAGCLVLVTSRRRLAGLGAQHAADIVSLKPLRPGDAADLLIRRSGRTSTDGQDRAVSELVKLCGYLPLAISLLAARLRAERGWSIETLVDELLVTHDRLSYMRAEDMQVSAAFDLSYKHLPTAQRRFFRRLGLNPGVDIDAYAAAALGDVSLSTAREYLDALYDDHLLEQPVQGRYRMHDLIGVYARARMANDPARQREQAIDRLLDYYAHAAATADRQLTPHRDVPRQPRFPLVLPSLGDAARATAWMTRELPNLLACAMYAAGRGDDSHLIDMSAALATFLRRAGSYPRVLALYRTAVDAANRLGDRAVRASALYHLGVFLRRATDYAGAAEAFAQARDLFRELGDKVGEARVLSDTGSLWRLAGDYPAAAEMLEQAVALFREFGDGAQQAVVISELAVIRSNMEDFSGAMRLLDEALALQPEAGNPLERASVLLVLASIQRQTHNYSLATQTSAQALTLYRSAGSQLGLAHAQLGLGVVCRLTGDHLRAARFLAEALPAYREIGDQLGQANALTESGIIHRATVDYHQAEQLLQEALSLYRKIPYRPGEAATLRELGVVRRLTGNDAEASAHLTQALAIYRELGRRTGQAEVLNDFGELHLDDGEARAADHFREALRLARRVGNPLEEARALEGIGRCHLPNGTSEAEEYLRAALGIYERIGAPAAARARTTLMSLYGPQ